VTAASGLAGHCDFHPQTLISSRTPVERPSNRSWI